MSQHNMNVANGSGLGVRTDINNALQALASLSSGASAPSPSFPCQLWADTGTSRLKRRNVANSAWVDEGPIDAALRDAASQGGFVADTGAANAYVCNFVPAITARSESTPLRFKVASANSAASTINDGLGTVALVGTTLAALVGGELVANGIAWIQWNATSGVYVLLFCAGAAGPAVNQVQTAFTTAGTAPSFTLTTAPALGGYAANQRFRVKFHATPTGTPTLNISGQGAKNLKQYDSGGSKVVANIASGQLADVEYDGTDMVILNPLPADWTAKAIGEPFGLFTHLTGVVEPPTNNPSYRFIKLTASDAYNTGVLTSESVSGSAPLVTATATISLSGSPINGQSIELMNTSRRALRAGSSGTAENDQIQGFQIGAVEAGGTRYGNVVGNATLGSAAFNAGSSYSGDSWQSSNTAGASTRLRPLADGTNGTVRDGTETRSKNIGVTYYMRIK